MPRNNLIKKVDREIERIFGKKLNINELRKLWEKIDKNVAKDFGVETFKDFIKYATRDRKAIREKLLADYARIRISEIREDVFKLKEELDKEGIPYFEPYRLIGLGNPEQGANYSSLYKVATEIEEWLEEIVPLKLLDDPSYKKVMATLKEYRECMLEADKSRV